MQARARQAGGQEKHLGGISLSQVEAALRPLIDPLLRDAHRRPRASDADDVLLDVKIDGVRCLLVLEHAPASLLSPREREIARMVSRGYPTKTIAADLGISTWTVSTHLRRIFVKLGVRTRAAMVARLAEGGLLPEMDSASDDERKL